jgi:hypothetical protein
LEALLNRASRENKSNTPDFLLAAFILRGLHAAEELVNSRERWYGVCHSPATMEGANACCEPAPGTPEEN